MSHMDIATISPVGLWKVTTEGDCEGRSVRDLGVWKGHVADIAFTLRYKAMYGLRFSPYEIKNPKQPESAVGDTVNISLNINTGTWDMDDPERIKAIKAFLDQENTKETVYDVVESNYFASVKLIKTGKKRGELVMWPSEDE